MESTTYIDFQGFIDRFPTIELPVQLDSESFHEINALHEPLPSILVSAFVKRTGEHEDLAEYVPVFRLPERENLTVVVFWRAGLLKYEYYLASYTKAGELVDQKVIASTVFSEERIQKSLARFDEEGIITVIEGSENPKSGELSPADSKQLFFEILENGTIQQSSKFSI